MSVQKDSRREGRLSLATLARSHAKYVIQITNGGILMLRIIKRLFPLEKEGEINRLSAELAAEKTRNAEIEDALVELGELYAEQDDALVELAGMIEEG